MGTYEIPRNVKGEGRILFIFTIKSLIYTAIATALGLIFYLIFNMLGLKIVGIIITIIFAAIGWSIGMLKVPEIASLKFTTQISGQNLDDIIKRALKFYSKKKKIYIYTKEEENSGDN